MESLRVMPPVPQTARIAAQTGYVDGVLVPKGTLIYIPVCLSPSGLAMADNLDTFVVQIRVVNTWKEIWGEDAEEYVSMLRWLPLQSLKRGQCILRFNPARWLKLPSIYH